MSETVDTSMAAVERWAEIWDGYDYGHGVAALLRALLTERTALRAVNKETRDALQGMVGLVQLVDHRYPDLKGNHRYVTAIAVLESLAAEAVPARAGEQET